MIQEGRFHFFEFFGGSMNFLGSTCAPRVGDGALAIANFCFSGIGFRPLYRFSFMEREEHW
ncbi:MAG: hypothetical protein DMF17_05250 [Verrucomicrobia bacterium]|nr:MAG: hypothetical protein DMF17_05250 [Verrucomicrobiota bacterium]